MVLEIKVSECYRLFMFISKPNYFRVLIALKDHMVVGPLQILSHINSHRLTIFVQIMIGVVGQHQSVVIERSLLLNAEQS